MESDWNWVSVPNSEAVWWSRRYKKKLPPGRYGGDVMRQHLSQYCGSCFLNAVVQMMEDRANIQSAIRRSEQEAKSLLEADWRVQRLDAQRALDDYTVVKRKSQQRQETGMVLGRSSTIRNWTACMGGMPQEVCDALVEGSLSLYPSPSPWIGVACAGRSYEPAKKLGVAQSPKIEVDVSNPSCVKWLAERVLEKGPVTVAIDSKLLVKSGFDGKLEEPMPHTSDSRDHVVVAVGWTRREGSVFWVMRNTWGEDEDVEMPSRPHASPFVLAECLSECKSASRDLEYCSTSKWKWRGMETHKGYFLVAADHSTNAGCIYSSPCGWVDAEPA